MILTTKTEKSGEEIKLTATYGSHVIELDYKKDKDLGMNHSLAAAEMRRRLGLSSRDLAGFVVKSTPDSSCEIEVGWFFVCFVCDREHSL